MASASHNTRLGGVKQELQDLGKDASSSLADFRASIDTMSLAIVLMLLRKVSRDMLMTLSPKN